MHSPYNNIVVPRDILLAQSFSDFPVPLPADDPPPQKRRRTHRPQVTGVYLFTPGNLVIPDDHKDVENEIRYYVHVILTSTNNRKHAIEGWARINRTLMRSIVGNPLKEGKARDWLLANHVMGTEFSYSSSNHVSNSYYLHPKYESPIRRWETTKNRLAHKIRRMRSLRLDDRSLRKLDEAVAWSDLTTDDKWVYQRLMGWCSRLTIDLDACRKTLRSLKQDEHDITMATTELIGTEDADYTTDAYLRFHSPLTRLYTPLREHLSIEGRRLVNVDIRNSQVVFFLKLMKERLLEQWIKEDDSMIEKEVKRNQVIVDHEEEKEEEVKRNQFIVDLEGEKKEEEKEVQTEGTMSSISSFNSNSNPLSTTSSPPLRPPSLSCTNKESVDRSYYQQNTSRLHSTLFSDIRQSSLIACFPPSFPSIPQQDQNNKTTEQYCDLDLFTQLVEKGQIYDYILNQITNQKDDSMQAYLLARLTRKAQGGIWKLRYRAFCCEHPVTTAEEARQRRNAYARTHRIKDIEVAPITELTRDHLKRLFFADIFYGRASVDTPLTRLFIRMFPTVYQMVLKAKEQKYQDLARLMQREEAKFMLHTVCRRLFKYHSEVPVFTIHDSIMTTEEHVPLVRRIINEEFDRIGLHPTLKEE